MKNNFSIAIVTVFLSFTYIFSQNNLELISDKAFFVMDFNGENVFKKLSTQDIENSYMFQSFVKKIKKQTSVAISSIQDIGMDVNQHVSFAMESDKDVLYTITLIPLTDKNKFANFLVEGMQAKVNLTTKKYKVYKPFEESSISYVVGDKLAVFISSTYIGQEYKVDYYSYDYYATDKAVNEVMKVYTETGDFAKAMEKAKVLNVELVKKNKAFKNNYEYPAEEIYEEIDYESLPEDYYEKQEEVYAFFDEKRRQEIEVDEKKQKDYVKQKEGERVALLLSGKKLAKSILTEESFKKAQDPTAEGLFWAGGNGVNQLYSGYSNPYNAYNSINPYASFNDPNSSVYGNFYFEKEKAKAKMVSEFGSTFQNLYLKGLSTKLNPKLYPIIDANTIGFLSLSYDTKTLLEEMPNLYREIATTTMPKYKDEFELAADVFSLLLDEQAVAEVFNGDAVFSLNGLTMKEVEYTSYDYDENYESKEVIKKRKDPIPSFTMGITSSNEALATKLFSYGLKKKFLIKKNDYYAINDTANKLPLDLFIGFNNGVLIFGTNENEVQNLVKGKQKTSLSKEMIAVLEANNYVFYFNNQRLFEVLPQDDIESIKAREYMDYIAKNTRDMIGVSRLENGKLISEFSINAPENELNSGKYLFQLIDKFMEIGAGN